jgi:hypothetical protein
MGKLPQARATARMASDNHHQGGLALITLPSAPAERIILLTFQSMVTPHSKTISNKRVLRVVVFGGFLCKRIGKGICIVITTLLGEGT